MFKVLHITGSLKLLHQYLIAGYEANGNVLRLLKHTQSICALFIIVLSKCEAQIDFSVGGIPQTLYNHAYPLNYEKVTQYTLETVSSRKVLP
jgi:hypothetical protein